MSAFQMHAPLDPECPNNPVTTFNEDPMTQYYGLGGDEEFTGPMEGRHRAECERCLKYGAANIEVVGP